MSEEKKEGNCSSSGGCCCCSCTKLLAGLLIGAFIFAAGMWFAESHGHHYMGGEKFCPLIAPIQK